MKMCLKCHPELYSCSEYYPYCNGAEHGADYVHGEVWSHVMMGNIISASRMKMAESFKDGLIAMESE